MSNYKKDRAFTMIEVIAVFAIMSLLVLLGYGYASPMINKTNERSVETVISLVVAAQQRHMLETGNWANNANDLSVGRGARLVSRAANSFGEVSMVVLNNNVVVASIDNSGECRAKLLRDPLTKAEPEEIIVAAGSACDANLIIGGVSQ